MRARRRGRTHERGWMGCASVLMHARRIRMGFSAGVVVRARTRGSSFSVLVLVVLKGGDWARGVGEAARRRQRQQAVRWRACLAHVDDERGC